MPRYIIEREIPGAGDFSRKHGVRFITNHSNAAAFE